MKPLHPYYAFRQTTREEHNASSINKAAPWDPNRSIKLWADPNPTDTEVDEERGEVATYKPVLAMLPNGRYKEGPDGQPTLGKITLTVDVAKSYNFPPPGGVFPPLGGLLTVVGPTGFGSNPIRITATHIANSQRFIQCPLDLPEGARIVYAPGIGGIAAVLLKGEVMPGTAAPGDGFTEADRKLLLRLDAAISEQGEALARIAFTLIRNPTPIR